MATQLSELETLAPERTTDDPPQNRRPAEVPASTGGGPNPFAIVGGALAAGVVLAKWIDRRGHVRARG